MRPAPVAPGIRSRAVRQPPDRSASVVILDAERGADMARSRRRSNRPHEDLIVAGGLPVANGGALRQACVWLRVITLNYCVHYEFVCAGYLLKAVGRSGMFEMRPNERALQDKGLRAASVAQTQDQIQDRYPASASASKSLPIRGGQTNPSVALAAFP